MRKKISETGVDEEVDGIASTFVTKVFLFNYLNSLKTLNAGFSHRLWDTFHHGTNILVVLGMCISKRNRKNTAR